VFHVEQSGSNGYRDPSTIQVFFDVTSPAGHRYRIRRVPFSVVCGLYGSIVTLQDPEAAAQDAAKLSDLGAAYEQAAALVGKGMVDPKLPDGATPWDLGLDEVSFLAIEIRKISGFGKGAAEEVAPLPEAGNS
jgi:hypothetical protein